MRDSKSQALKATVIVILALTTAAGHGADKLAVKCATAKQKAAVKKLAAKLKCYQKAAADDQTVDQACLTLAETKFGAAIMKADAKGGCVVTGDETAIEQAADACLTSIGSLTPFSHPTCGNTSYPQCGGTCPSGLSCQPYIQLDTECSPGSGGATTCTSSCKCVDPATACNGQPCNQICSVTTTGGTGGCGDTRTEVCCGGLGGFCDTNSGPSCCCGNQVCYQPPRFAGECQQGPSCNATHDQELCQ